MDSSRNASDGESVVAGCNNLIKKLRQCADEATIFQRVIMGSCNALTMEVQRCRTEAWKARQADNYKKSQEMKRKLSEKLNKEEIQS